MAGGVGHQPHHDGLKVLPSGLVLIVQSLQGSLLVSCQVTNLLLPHFSSPPLMGSDLVKKVKIPPWPDTETTQRQSPNSDQGSAHETAGYRCFVDFRCVLTVTLSGSCYTLDTGYYQSLTGFELARGSDGIN